MPDLIPFAYHNYSIRTLQHDDGATWFIATDVCAVLGQPNVSQVCTRLDEDEKGIHTLDTPGGQQEILIVNEPGLYKLIMRSRKQEAKTFQRWVTHEVLPQIRKTGAYGQPQTPAVLNPEHQMMIDMIVRIDQNEQRSIAAERHAAQAQLDAAHASANALRAMECQSFFTIAEYVYIHKLQRQLPPSAYKAASDHLRAYSLDNKTPPPRKVQVWDRTWKDEWSFHITIFVEAFDPWLLRRGAQTNLRVLPDPYEGNN